MDFVFPRSPRRTHYFPRVRSLKPANPTIENKKKTCKKSFSWRRLAQKFEVQVVSLGCRLVSFDLRHVTRRIFFRSWTWTRRQSNHACCVEISHALVWPGLLRQVLQLTIILFTTIYHGSCLPQVCAINWTYPIVVMVTIAHQNPSKAPRLNLRGNSSGLCDESCNRETLVLESR